MDDKGNSYGFVFLNSQSRFRKSSHHCLIIGATAALVGDTIVWINKDVLVHIATAHDKSFDILQPAKQTVSQTLVKAGSFDSYCKYHPNMTGRPVIAP